MEEITLHRDEKMMLVQKVLHFRSRIFAAPGVLYLTNQRLVFLPGTILGRAIGAEKIALPLRDVVDVSIEGRVDQRMVVKTRSGEFGFRSRSLLQGFHDRLKAWSVAAKGRGPHARPSQAVEGARAEEKRTTWEEFVIEAASAGIRLIPPTGAPLDERKEVLILGDTDLWGVGIGAIVERLGLNYLAFEEAEGGLAALWAKPEAYALIVANLLDPAFGAMEFLSKRSEWGVGGEIPTWVIEPLFDKAPEGVLEGLGVRGFLNKSVEPNDASDLLNRMFRGEATPPSRRHPRVTAHFPVECMQAGAKQVGYAKTLGTGGIFVQCQKPADLGDRVELRFALPKDPNVIEVSGSIVYVMPRKDEGQRRDPGMGIRFLDLLPDQQMRIRSFVEDVLKEKADRAGVVLGS